MKLEDHFSKRCTFFLCTRNRAKLLAENLERFKSLKKANDELIVIDGGSTDGAVDVIKSHLGLVDKFVSEPDRSEGDALNKALMIAQGKYLKILTDDDIFHEDAIEKAFTVMDEHPEVDVLLCGVTVEYENHAVVETRAVPPGVQYGKHPGDVFDYLGNWLGSVIRHTSLTRTGIFNAQAFCTDNDFLTQCIASGANVKFCRLNACNHMIYAHSFSMAHSERLHKDQARIARKYGRRDWAYRKYPRNAFERAMRLYYHYRPNFWRRLKRKLSGAPIDNPPPVWDGSLS